LIVRNRRAGGTLPVEKGHKDAVALFEAYAKSGDDPELKSWAAKTLPHLKEHLSMAEKLK
jgi:putative membrane protein